MLNLVVACRKHQRFDPAYSAARSWDSHMNFSETIGHHFPHEISVFPCHSFWTAETGCSMESKQGSHPYVFSQILKFWSGSCFREFAKVDPAANKKQFAYKYGVRWRASAFLPNLWNSTMLAQTPWTSFYGKFKCSLFHRFLLSRIWTSEPGKQKRKNRSFSSQRRSCRLEALSCLAQVASCCWRCIICFHRCFAGIVPFF